MIRWLMILALVGCAASTRQKTLTTTLTATEAASRALLAYDRVHELELVDAAKSKPEAQAAILGWHSERDKAQAALIATYEALAVAGTVNDDPSIAGAIKAWGDLHALLVTIGVLK